MPCARLRLLCSSSRSWSTECAKKTFNKRPRRSVLGNHVCSGRYVLASTRPAWFSTATATDNKKDISEDTSKSRIRPVYDTSPNWEDWFTPEEYGNAWEYPDSPIVATAEEIDPSETRTQEYALSRRRWILEPLEEDTALDASSRHLIRQLQNLYQDGYQSENITFQRCYHMMYELLGSAERVAYTHRGQGDDGATLIRQRIIRAEALLRTMELFWDFVPDVTEVKAQNSLQQLPKGRMTHQEHSSKPTVKWPLPTYEMYVSVARGLTSLRFPKQYQTLDNSDVPWICQDLVVRQHYLQLMKGFVHLKKMPVEGWNQVLTCWANARGDRDHPEKALHATQFFMDMKLLYKVVPDASSYSGVLRACAHHDHNEKAKELGAKLAARVWKAVMVEELHLQTFAPTPRTFVFLMRALANLQQDKEVLLKEAWEEACRAGVVNEHVLYELEEASTFLFRELLSSYRELVDTREMQKSLPSAYDKTYHKALMQFLPVEWTKRVKGEPPVDSQELPSNASSEQEPASHAQNESRADE